MKITGLIFLSGRTCTIGGWLNTFLLHCICTNMTSSVIYAKYKINVVKLRRLRYYNPSRTLTPSTISITSFKLEPLGERKPELSTTQLLVFSSRPGVSGSLLGVFDCWGETALWEPASLGSPLTVDVMVFSCTGDISLKISMRERSKDELDMNEQKQLPEQCVLPWKTA